MSENQIWAQRSALGNWKQLLWFRNVIFSSLTVIYGVVSINPPKRKTLITRRIIFFVCKCFWPFSFKPFFIASIHSIKLKSTIIGQRLQNLWGGVRSKPSWCPSAWSTGGLRLGEPLPLLLPPWGWLMGMECPGKQGEVRLLHSLPLHFLAVASVLQGMYSIQLANITPPETFSITHYLFPVPYVQFAAFVDTCV